MQQLINDEARNLFELQYFNQSVKVFRTDSNQFHTLIKHTSIIKNWPLRKDVFEYAISIFNFNPITYGILIFRQLSGAFWPGSRKQGYS